MVPCTTTEPDPSGCRGPVAPPPATAGKQGPSSGRIHPRGTEYTNGQRAEQTSDRPASHALQPPAQGIKPQHKLSAALIFTPASLLIRQPAANYAPRTDLRACGTPHAQQPPSPTASSRAQPSLLLPTRNCSYSQPALESLLNAALTPLSPRPARNQGLSLFSLGPLWFYSHIPDDSPNAHGTHGARQSLRL